MSDEKKLILPKFNPMTLQTLENEKLCDMYIDALKKHARKFVEVNGNLEFTLDGQTIIITPEMRHNAQMLRMIPLSLTLMYVDHAKFIHDITERSMNDFNKDDK